MVALGRGSPTVAPLRVRVVRSAMVEGGGDLLRRPTEVTAAPPAMLRYGFPTEGDQQVILHLYFQQMYLSEILLYID